MNAWKDMYMFRGNNKNCNNIINKQLRFDSKTINNVFTA